MTPEEFAAQTGLSLEEAEMVLKMRASGNVSPFGPFRKSGTMGRLQAAYEALAKAEQKVGVKPYEESK